jgi:hypothetical protein
VERCVEPAKADITGQEWVGGVVVCGGGKKGTRGEVVETEWATESGGSAQTSW